jgi:hypothetical protein
MERRLAAILATDAVGYSRLMDEDEADAEAPDTVWPLSKIAYPRREVSWDDWVALPDKPLA